MAESVFYTLGAGLEQVKDKVMDYTSVETGVLATIKMSNVAQISRWGYRIPFLRWRGGSLGKFVADRGVLPNGTGARLAYMQAGYISSAYSQEVTVEQIETSRSSQQAVFNVLAELMAGTTETIAGHDNIHFMGDGTGFLTNVSSAKPAANQLTFAGTTDTIGVSRIFRGMAVSIWDSAGTTLRAGGPYTINAIDYENGIVTFTANPTGLTSGDRLAVADVDAYGPSSPTTKSSTWPGDGLTNGPGMTGDSWRHGIEYANSATTSEYYLGKLKSSYPELLPQYVNGGGFTINWEMVELGKNKLIMARDEKVLDGMMAMMHLCQGDVLKESQVKIAHWDIQSAGGQYMDLPPQIKPNQFFNLNGIPAFLTKLANKSRVDYINPKNWGRVQSRDPFFFQDPNDSGDAVKFFPLQTTSGSGYLAGWQFWILSMFDWVCHDPGASMYIDGLRVKTGYKATEVYG